MSQRNPSFNLHSIETMLAAATQRGWLGSGRKLFVGNSSVLAHLGISGNDGNGGDDIKRPYATFEGAMSSGKLVANREDNIILLPGHAESITEASDSSGFDLDTAGVKVLGLGQGTLQPTFTLTTAIGANIDINAANCAVRGITVTCNFADVTAMISVTAADATIEDCTVHQGTTTNDCVVGLLTDANADRMLLRNCKFLDVNRAPGSATVDADNSVQIVGGQDIWIDGCYMSGRPVAASGNIEIITTATTNLRVTGCTLQNFTNVATKNITDTITGSTGFTNLNYYKILNGTAPETFASGDRGLNYYANAVNTAYTAVG